MNQIKRWKHLGSLSLGLAAGSICLSPVLAQQLAPRLLPEPVQLAQAEAIRPPDKEVTLSAQGGIRVVTLTGDGSPVSGARVTFTPVQDSRATPLSIRTNARGEVLVSGIKPGVYQVRIEAEQGTYEGTVLVREADPNAGSEQQLVVFTLSLPPASGAAPGASAGGLAGGRGLLLPLVGIGLGATGTALALALEGGNGGQPRPVSSP
jgi:hypothetical protein